ncbi:uncharacterized protein LOC107271757 isoform X2 [Cephus cinctus]|uniref:Uncharacterized protein LOC107271757 isoform X2 n=1 Tax=Cephus cinctus TaxID=211228 RepID=A0AAJ7C8H5_CEPCN|nr:uncharacterized protein LOC107271757 isoform X2 [Cephus cinctus]
MKLIFYIFTLLYLYVSNSRASSIDVTQGDEYLRKIVEDVWNQLVENDFSNLPVGDYDLAYNTTTWGHELVGHAYYEDGFVMDIESLEVDNRGTSTIISKSEVTLYSTVQFRNLEVFFDVRTEFTVGNKVGTVIIRPAVYIYNIRFTQDLATMNVASAIYSESNKQENYDWDFSPDDPLFARIKKHYISQASGTSIIRNAVSNWRPILEKMLTNAVKRTKFPDLIL